MSISKRKNSIRQALFSRYDRLNEVLDEAESQLIAMHINRPVAYCFEGFGESENPAELNLAQYIGIQWYGGKLRLCYCCQHIQDEHELEARGLDPSDSAHWEWKAVRDCSILVRIEAARHFEGLRDAILESHEKFIPEVEAAIKDLAEKLEHPVSDE